MQRIGAEEAHWRHSLKDDLEFIKKHKRYPFSNKTLGPALMLSLFVPGVTYLILSLVSNLEQPQSEGQSRFAPYRFLILFSWIIIQGTITAMRHWKMLRFQEIETAFNASENGILLEQFLRQLHLRVYRNPDYPDVIQILSSPVNNQKQREVVLFIADSKRILVNSHFTHTSKFQIFAGYRHHKEIVDQFQKWLLQNANIHISQYPVAI